MADYLTNPIDSAFVQGHLLMSKVPQAHQIHEAVFPWIDVLALISILPFLFFLKSFIEFIPSILSCALRTKECINLENNIKLSQIRNRLALSLIMPFVLIVFNKELYRPSFYMALEPGFQILVLIGIVIVYTILAWSFSKLMAPESSKKRHYRIACRSSYNFFILLVLFLLLAVAILELFGISGKAAQNTLYWIFGLTYVLYIVRKFQIFASSFPIFTAILYLCALEIIPTGALIVSAIIF